MAELHVHPHPNPLPQAGEGATARTAGAGGCLPARVQMLLAATPDRLLWASDRPHTEPQARVPQAAELAEPLVDWVPDDGLRLRIAVDNPAGLYGFDAAH